MPANVFLSYALTDRDFAGKLRDSLARMGIESAAVEPDLGSNWEDDLRNALERSDVIVGVLSPASLDSAFAMQELGAAMMLDKPLVLINPGPGPLPSTRMPHRTILDGAGMTTDQIAAEIQQSLPA